MDLAQSYGQKLYTGVFYRNPTPPPTYESLVRERQQALDTSAYPASAFSTSFCSSRSSAWQFAASTYHAHPARRA